MKALMMVVSNSEEIEEAKQAQIKVDGKEVNPIAIPEKKYDYTEFLFDPSNVSLSYVGSDGSIRILYDGQDLSLKYDEKIFKGLEDNFSNRK